MKVSPKRAGIKYVVKPQHSLPGRLVLEPCSSEPRIGCRSPVVFSLRGKCFPVALTKQYSLAHTNNWGLAVSIGIKYHYKQHHLSAGFIMGWLQARLCLKPCLSHPLQGHCQEWCQNCEQILQRSGEVCSCETKAEHLPDLWLQNYQGWKSWISWRKVVAVLWCHWCYDVTGVDMMSLGGKWRISCSLIFEEV